MDQSLKDELESLYTFQKERVETLKKKEEKSKRLDPRGFREVSLMRDILVALKAFGPGEAPGGTPGEVVLERIIIQLKDIPLDSRGQGIYAGLLRIKNKLSEGGDKLDKGGVGVSEGEDS